MVFDHFGINIKVNIALVFDETITYCLQQFD